MDEESDRKRIMAQWALCLFVVMLVAGLNSGKSGVTGLSVASELNNSANAAIIPTLVITFCLVLLFVLRYLDYRKLKSLHQQLNIREDTYTKIKPAIVPYIRSGYTLKQLRVMLLNKGWSNLAVDYILDRARKDLKIKDNL